jgi:hypothetical protein
MFAVGDTLAASVLWVIDRNWTTLVYAVAAAASTVYVARSVYLRLQAASSMPV